MSDRAKWHGKSALQRMEDYSIPVPESGCYLWIASKSDGRYGQIMVSGKAWHAHRLAWTLANGEIPDGAWVLHKCDTPSCVNPKHLFLGTPADNHDDGVKKGRISWNDRGRFARNFA